MGFGVLRDLLYFEPEGAGTDIAEALNLLNRAVRRRGHGLSGQRFPREILPSAGCVHSAWRRGDTI